MASVIFFAIFLIARIFLPEHHYVIHGARLGWWRDGSTRTQ